MPLVHDYRPIVRLHSQLNPPPPPLSALELARAYFPLPDPSSQWHRYDPSVLFTEDIVKTVAEDAQKIERTLKREIVGCDVRGVGRASSASV